MPYSTLKLEISADIATITLNRPEKRNAISTKMINDLMGAFAEIETNSARVAILTGEGKAFCSGIDLAALKAIAAQSPEENLEDARRFARLLRRIWSFPKPTIAAVNGAAIAVDAASPHFAISRWRSPKPRSDIRRCASDSFPQMWRYF